MIYNKACDDSENEGINTPLLNNKYKIICEDAIRKFKESPVITSRELLKVAADLQKALILGGIPEAALELSNLYKNKFIESSNKLDQLYQAIHDNLKNTQYQSYESNISCIDALAKKYVETINDNKSKYSACQETDQILQEAVEYFKVTDPSCPIEIFINYPLNKLPIDIGKYQMEVVGEASCCLSCCAIS